MAAQGSETPVVTYRRRGVDRTTAKLGMELKEAAAAIGVSYMTLWRAVRDGEFPAVKVRGRHVVPVRALEMLFDATLAAGGELDAAEWTKSWSADTSASGEVA